MVSHKTWKPIKIDKIVDLEYIKQNQQSLCIYEKPEGKFNIWYKTKGGVISRLKTKTDNFEWLPDESSFIGYEDKKGNITIIDVLQIKNTDYEGHSITSKVPLMERVQEQLIQHNIEDITVAPKVFGETVNLYEYLASQFRFDIDKVFIVEDIKPILGDLYTKNRYRLQERFLLNKMALPILKVKHTGRTQNMVGKLEGNLKDHLYWKHVITEEKYLGKLVDLPIYKENILIPVTKEEFYGIIEKYEFVFADGTKVWSESSLGLVPRIDGEYAAHIFPGKEPIILSIIV